MTTAETFEDFSQYPLSKEDADRVAHAIHLQIEQEKLALTVTPKHTKEHAVLSEDIEAYKLLYRHFSGRMYE